MKTIICIECKQSKPHKANGLCGTCYAREWRKNNPDAATAMAARCYQNNKEKDNERSRQHYRNNRDIRLASQKEYHIAHRDERLAAMDERRENMTPESKDATKKYQRNWKLQNRYGLTSEEYEKLVEEQNGLCAVCGQPQSAPSRDGSKKLHIDHNHTTGEVRGLLCLRCNTSIAQLEDTEWTSKATEYLKKFDK